MAAVSSEASWSTCLSAGECSSCNAGARFKHRCSQRLHGLTYPCRGCALVWHCPNCNKHAEPGELVPNSEASSVTAPSQMSATMGAIVSLAASSDAAADTLAADIVGTAGLSPGIAGAISVWAEAAEDTMHRVLLFVAVPECVKDVVISEGFKARWRNHIPATMSENQALASFARASHGTMGAVLAITSLRDGIGKPHCVTACDGGSGFKVRVPGLLPRRLMDASSVLYAAVPLDL